MGIRYLDTTSSNVDSSASIGKIRYIDVPEERKSFIQEVGQGAVNELSAAQSVAGKIVNPIKTGMEVGRAAAQTIFDNSSVMDKGRGVRELARQGVVDPVKAMGKAVADTIIHPVKTFKESPISTVATALPLARATGMAIAKAGAPLTRKATSVALGPSTEAISARMNNPSAIREAKTFSEIAERVPETLDKLQGEISRADGEAWKTLSKSNAAAEGAIPKAEISKVIGGVKKEIGELVGKSDKEAYKVLSEIENDISRLKGNALSEQRIKKMIQKIDDNIDWTNTRATQTNRTLQSARSKLDSILKARNTAYSEAMRPVDEMMNVLMDSEKLFVPKKTPGKGYAITDTTVSKLQNIHKGSPKDASRIVLEKLKKATGHDYLSDTQNAAYAKQFEQPTTHGSRRTVLGSVVGGGIGKLTGSPTTGALAGGLAGYIADVEGGKLAGKLIDIVSPIKKAVSPILRKTGKSFVFNPQNILLGQTINTERGRIRITGFDKKGNIIGEPIYTRNQ